MIIYQQKGWIMSWKRTIAISAATAALVMMTGCGGGGSGSNSCDAVPAWTGVKAPMQNTQNVQNAMSALYHVGLASSELLHEPKKEASTTDAIGDKNVLQKLADRFNVLRSDGVTGVEGMTPSGVKPSVESHEENCSVGGTRTVTYEEYSDENKSEGYYLTTYRFHDCKEYKGFVEDLIQDLEPGYLLENGEYKPTSDTYMFNGEISEKSYGGEDGNESMEGYRLSTDDLTVKMENNETLDNGTLEATIYAQVEARRKKAYESTQIEDATESVTLSLASDGCLSLVFNKDDENGSTTKVADADLQAVNFNATIARYSVEEENSTIEGGMVTLDGYIGTSGSVDIDMAEPVEYAGVVEPDGQTDLGAFALYGKNFAFEAKRMGDESNATVSGTLATPCMGGAVTYSGNMNFYAKYASQDGNKTLLPYTGSVTLQGAADATVDFHLNENNQTNATTSVDENKTYGSWDALIEGNCTTLFNEAVGAMDFLE